MHPVEHIIYSSTLVVQWLLALHPVNALFQLHLVAFYPALAHCGFGKLMLGKTLGIDGGGHFHYLHHKYFECNYGGSLAAASVKLIQATQFMLVEHGCRFQSIDARSSSD